MEVIIEEFGGSIIILMLGTSILGVLSYIATIV